ncbi:hypothetical protein HY029_03865, partial [Candidatus Gottesmanbacteria bacterium]|nr:hypothetical protein [Candidatus Gottesmanbacteria bacterium]
MTALQVNFIINNKVVGGALYVSKSYKEHVSTSNSMFPTATKCSAITISKLSDFTTSDGTFKDLNNSWEMGPKNNTVNVSGVFPLAYYPLCDLETGEISVDFQLVGGQEDKYAGLVFGLTTTGDYYVVRASGSENSVTIAKFVNNTRTVLKTFDTPVSTNAWNTLKVTITKDTLSILLNNQSIMNN